MNYTGLYKILALHFALALMLLTNSCKPPLRSNIQSIVDTMQTRNLGEYGQNEREELLSQSATTEELFFLTNHQSPVVRCYAFAVLSQRNIPGFLSLIKSHLNDSSKVVLCGGDVIDQITVSDHLENVIIPRCINHLTLTDADYPYVRELANSHNMNLAPAIVALAKYRRISDISVIKETLLNPATHSYGLQAIAAFPNEELFPLLKTFHNQIISSKESYYFLGYPLYEAIVQYKKPESLDMLSAGLAIKKDHWGHPYRISIATALRKYPNEYFRPILDQIKLSQEEEVAVVEALKRTD